MNPTLTVVCGNACTGKTTWARVLAARTGSALFDIDTASERLVETAQVELGRDPKDRDSATYKRVYREAIHETLFALARDNTVPTIIVAPFTLERQRVDFDAWLETKALRAVQVHYFVSNDAVRRARLVARCNPRDLLKLQDFASYATVGREEARPCYRHEWFDTSSSFPDVDQFLRQAVAR